MPAISAISATPNSAVSQLVHERRGRDLMPELGYKPVNKYLPPRPGRMSRNLAALPQCTAPAAAPSSPADKLLRWVDRLLSR